MFKGRIDLGRCEVRTSLVEDGDPLLDAGQGLADFEFKCLEHPERVIVGARPDQLGLRARLGEDLEALDFGSFEQPTLADEECCLLLGSAGNAAGLIVGLLDDPLTLGVDPLGGAHFLGNGYPKLIDEIEDPVPIDDRVPGEWQRLATRDQGFEPLKEEDDVQSASLQQGGSAAIIARWSVIDRERTH